MITSNLKQIKTLLLFLTDKRHFSASVVLNAYGGTWKNSRLQNPNLTKSIPTNEFVKVGKLKNTNLVYVCGFGATGSLGVERYYRPDLKNVEGVKSKSIGSSTFKRLGLEAGTVKAIACGYGFTIIAAELNNSSHSVLGFGLNSHSQLGCHESRPGYPLEIVATPGIIYLPTSSPVHLVACGRSHSILVDKTGNVFSLGNNSMGQCGRKIKEDEVYLGSRTIHHIRDLPTNIAQVECGQDHSFFLTTDGELYACGWGADGQTGLGHYDVQSKPQKVKGDIEGVKIIKVSSYADTTLALSEGGDVFGWGNTEYLQFRILANCEDEQFNVPRRLKIDNVPGTIVDIAAGGTICAVLNNLGQVYVWGFGILGKGPDVEQSTRPTLIPESLFGKNIYNRETKVLKIYAGLSNFAAITSEGDLYTWGKNRGRALGFAHQKDQYFPMRVNMNLAKTKSVSLGVDHTCAIVEKVC